MAKSRVLFPLLCSESWQVENTFPASMYQWNVGSQCWYLVCFQLLASAQPSVYCIMREQTQTAHGRCFSEEACCVGVCLEHPFCSLAESRWTIVPRRGLSGSSAWKCRSASYLDPTTKLKYRVNILYLQRWEEPFVLHTHHSHLYLFSCLNRNDSERIFRIFRNQMPLREKCVISSTFKMC